MTCNLMCWWKAMAVRLHWVVFFKAVWRPSTLWYRKGYIVNSHWSIIGATVGSAVQVSGSLALIELSGDYVSRIFDLLFQPNVHRLCGYKQFSRNQFHYFTIVFQDVSTIWKASNMVGKLFFLSLTSPNRHIKVSGIYYKSCFSYCLKNQKLLYFCLLILLLKIILRYYCRKYSKWFFFVFNLNCLCRRKDMHVWFMHDSRLRGLSLCKSAT